MDDARPAWLDDEWLALLLGVDQAAHATVATFDALAWSAAPLPDEPPPADELVDALLGLDHLARRIVALCERCGDAAPVPAPTAPPAPGSILR